MAIAQIGKNNFPKELVLEIFFYLNAQDLKVCALTCKYWHQLSQNNHVWHAVCLNTIPSQTDLHYNDSIKYRHFFKMNGPAKFKYFSFTKMIIKETYNNLYYSEISMAKKAVSAILLSMITPPLAMMVMVPMDLVVFPQHFCTKKEERCTCLSCDTIRKS